MEDQQLSVMRENFRKLDTENDGVIKYKNFIKKVKKSGILKKNPELLKLIKNFDIKSKGKENIEYHNFLIASLK
jgi:Ca2+-binding EF-hand superfamily protein